MSPAVLEVLERSRSLGFLGPGDLGLQVHHARGFAVALSAAVADVGLADAAHPPVVLDLGSGGGLPGLVLAECWPDAVVRSSRFRRAADRLPAGGGGLPALGGESPGGSGSGGDGWSGGRAAGQFDVVVARSFGPPPVTAECGAPFLGVGGFLIVSEPPAEDHGNPKAGTRGQGDGPRRWPAEGLAELGLETVGTYGDPYGFQVMRQVRSCPDRYPRRVGVPAKRPLYLVPSDR